MRYVGLDVHKRWTQVAWHHEDGSIDRERIATDPVLLQQLAERLRKDDVVALESTTNALPIARLLARRAGTVLISNPLKTRLIAESRTKTDKVDADVLAQLARSGFLPTVWQPTDDVQLARRRAAYHQALGRQLTRVKNRLHAVIHRNLVAAPVADLVCETGRRFLRTVDLPLDERLQVDADLALLAHLEATRAEAARVLAAHAHASPDVQLLMTVPGIDYGTGVRGRTVRARQDRERLQAAQRQYEQFLNERRQGETVLHEKR